MYLVIEVLLTILIALVPIYLPFWKCLRSKSQQKWRRFWRAQRLNLVAALILLVGAAVRLIAIESFPIGLNQDEASIGYEAYSILNFGIDRNGNSVPAHFVSWASGQNALYAYMIIPFVGVWGNTIFAIRLPMALIGCITLVVTFFAFRKIFDEKKAIVFLGLLAIMPWHIMKSRWGLESNVFPDMIYWVTILIYFGVHEKRSKPLFLSSFLLGLSTYAYGTSYLFVPLFFALVYGYLLWQKKVQWKTALINLVIIGVIALPMVLFVLINYFELNTVKLLGFITVPRLDYNRFTAITSVNGNFIRNCWINLKETIKIIIFQMDGSVLGSMNYTGLFYVFSLPFLLIGIFNAVKSKLMFWRITNCTMIAALVVAVFVSPNINRINTLWLPAVLYTGLGLIECFYHQKANFVIVLACYLVAFGGFLRYYFTAYQNNFRDTAESASCNETFYGLCEAIKFASSTEHDNLYISDWINQPYIYYLWCTEMSPYDYLIERRITEKNVMFQEVTRIGNVVFEMPEKLKSHNTYILETRRLHDYNTDGFKSQAFGNYTVVY